MSVLLIYHSETPGQLKNEVWRARVQWEEVFLYCSLGFQGTGSLFLFRDQRLLGLGHVRLPSEDSLWCGHKDNETDVSNTMLYLH